MMTDLEFLMLGALTTLGGLALALYTMRWQDKNLPPRKSDE